MSINECPLKRTRGFSCYFLLPVIGIAAFVGLFFLAKSFFFPVRVAEIDSAPIVEGHLSNTSGSGESAGESLAVPLLMNETGNDGISDSRESSSYGGGAEPVSDGGATSSSSGMSRWGIQIGAFRDRNDAERVVSEARKSGFDAYVMETPGGWCRVRVNGGGSRENAESVQDKLRSAGYDTLICTAKN